MSITKESELIGMQAISEAVAITLREMRNHVRPGMSTKELDDFGGKILSGFGAKSAPALTYNFPGWTCISLNNEVAHGIPSKYKIIREGDLINVDVSAELNGFWSDNGGSFVVGKDTHNHQKLVDASREILFKAIQHIKTGVRISDIGHLIETEAHKKGFVVIENLAGHGVGRALHEKPDNLLNYGDPHDRRKFKKNSVIALETFISTHSDIAVQQNDGWTLLGNKSGFVAQHEHTLVITDGEPIILTAMNEIWN